MFGWIEKFLGSQLYIIDRLKPEQYGPYLQTTFSNEFSLIEIFVRLSLKKFPNGPIDSKELLVQALVPSQFGKKPLLEVLNQ